MTKSGITVYAPINALLICAIVFVTRGSNPAGWPAEGRFIVVFMIFIVNFVLIPAITSDDIK